MAMCYPDTTDWSCALTPEEITDLDPVKKARAEALAWNSLQRLTGFRLALCPVVLRPCAARCTPSAWIEAPVTGWPGDGPYISNGVWYNACGCTSPGSCSCGPISEVILPAQEVSGPIIVKINGGTLDPSSYRVDNGNRLVRQDGGTWPLCQDMGAPDTADAFTPLEGTYGTSGSYVFMRDGDTVTVTIQPDVADSLGIALPQAFTPTIYQVVAEDADTRVFVQNVAGTGTFLVDRTTANPPAPLTFSYLAVEATPDLLTDARTFSVSYYPGVAADDLLSFAAGILAVEWYKACDGKACRLPDGAQRVTRQGISFEVPADMFTGGLSGIREVDNIVGQYNPFHLAMPSSVFSPDARRGRMRTY